MLRCASQLMLLGLLISTTGCAIGKVPDDWAYSAYGGSWQRDDPVRGRVGSILESGGQQHVLVGPSAMSQPDSGPRMDEEAVEQPPEPSEILPAPPESDPLREPAELGPPAYPPSPQPMPEADPNSLPIPQPGASPLEPSF